MAIDIRLYSETPRLTVLSVETLATSMDDDGLRMIEFHKLFVFLPLVELFILVEETLNGGLGI